MTRSTTTRVTITCLAIVLGSVACSCMPNTFGLGAHVFAVNVINDLPDTVEVRQCTLTDCGHIVNRYEVEPTRSTSVGVTDSGDTQRIEIGNSAGATIGCLDLTFNRRQPGLRIYVSARRPCA